MLFPILEFYGKGRPLSKVIAAFDIDSNKHIHIIGKEGYCVKCLNDSIKKAREISEILLDEGFNYIRVFSGSKGFHFYILDENNKMVKEIPAKDYLDLITYINRKLKENYIDNINFKSKMNTLDLHRIFKLPNSIDASTGILIKEGFHKLNFKDEFQELE